VDDFTILDYKLHNIFLHPTGVPLRFTPAGEKCVMPQTNEGAAIMNDAGVMLDRIRSKNFTRIVLLSTVATALFYLATLSTIAFGVWNIISGFVGIRLYIFIASIAVAITARIVAKKTSAYLGLDKIDDRLRKMHKLEKKKITIIGIGLNGFILLSKLKRAALPFQDRLYLVSVIDDIRAMYRLDAHIQPKKEGGGSFTVQGSEVVEAIKNSDLVALVADYGEDISIDLTPFIVRIVQEESCIIELYITMPFLHLGEQKCARAVEKANELLQLKVDNLKHYNLDLLGSTYMQVEPVKKYEAAKLATEKVTEMIIDDLSRRITTTMQKTSIKSQVSDIHRLALDIEE